MTEDRNFVNTRYTPTQPSSTPTPNRTYPKYKTRRCALSPEQRAAGMLREFKREARQWGCCCELCWRSKTLGSMAIVDVLRIDGRPVGAYAICNRCRSKYRCFELAEFKRLVELGLAIDWLEWN